MRATCRRRNTRLLERTLSGAVEKATLAMAQTGPVSGLLVATMRPRCEALSSFKRYRSLLERFVVPMLR